MEVMAWVGAWLMGGGAGGVGGGGAEGARVGERN